MAKVVTDDNISFQSFKDATAAARAEANLAKAERELITTARLALPGQVDTILAPKLSNADAVTNLANQRLNLTGTVAGDGDLTGKPAGTYRSGARLVVWNGTAITSASDPLPSASSVADIALAASQAMIVAGMARAYESRTTDNPRNPTAGELALVPNPVGSKRTADGGLQPLKWSNTSNAWVADGAALGAGGGGTVDATVRSAIGNTALTALATKGQADGPQFVDGSRWLWRAGGIANGGTVVAASGSGYWVREFVGAVSPLWWGAEFDGVADDTAAIQAAINYAADNGAVCQLPGGTATVTQLRLRGMVRGSGASRTILKRKASGAVQPYKVVVGSVTHTFSPTVVLAAFGWYGDFEVQGNGPYLFSNVLNNLSELGPQQDGVLCLNPGVFDGVGNAGSDPAVSRLHVEKLRVAQFYGAGLALVNVFDSEFVGCHVENCGMPTALPGQYMTQPTAKTQVMLLGTMGDTTNETSFFGLQSERPYVIRGTTPVPQPWNIYLHNVLSIRIYGLHAESYADSPWVTVLGISAQGVEGSGWRIDKDSYPAVAVTGGDTWDVSGVRTNGDLVVDSLYGKFTFGGSTFANVRASGRWGAGSTLDFNGCQIRSMRVDSTGGTVNYNGGQVRGGSDWGGGKTAGVYVIGDNTLNLNTVINTSAAGYTGVLWDAGAGRFISGSCQVLSGAAPAVNYNGTAGLTGRLVTGPASGLTASSTAAEVVAALQAVGLAT
ncbi:hypothetical protein [Deinococcus apachensis]|uniref:hypothetical protein n=1 Tax=Deinococcus apachensis TaxID=309886 RepID=UPI00037AF1A7|nr:hypothetical protein [Deinococcus apachensis]